MILKGWGVFPRQDDPETTAAGRRYTAGECQAAGSGLTLVERREFVSASGGLGFTGAERKQIDGLVERTLQAHEHLRRSKKDKGIVRRYLAKISGFSS